WGSYTSAEGQADYFAAKDCLWRVYEDDPNNAAFRTIVPERARVLCDAAWKDQPRRDICYRTALVGQAAIHWVKEGEWGNISTPDQNVVALTLTGHPDAQCRIDTNLAGAVCPVLN